MTSAEKEAAKKKEEAAKKTKKKKMVNKIVSIAVAIISGIGLNKLNMWMAQKGDKEEKIASLLELATGVGLQFTKSQIAQAAGLVAAAMGSTSAIRAFTTDAGGNVKPDKVSQTLAKLVMPPTPTDGGVNGLGRLQIDQGYMQEPVPQYNSIVARAV